MQCLLFCWIVTLHIPASTLSGVERGDTKPYTADQYHDFPRRSFRNAHDETFNEVKPKILTNISQGSGNRNGKEQTFPKTVDLSPGVVFSARKGIRKIPWRNDNVVSSEEHGKSFTFKLPYGGYRQDHTAIVCCKLPFLIRRSLKTWRKNSHGKSATKAHKTFKYPNLFRGRPPALTFLKLLILLRPSRFRSSHGNSPRLRNPKVKSQSHIPVLDPLKGTAHNEKSLSSLKPHHSNQRSHFDHRDKSSKMDEQARVLTWQTDLYSNSNLRDLERSTQLQSVKEASNTGNNGTAVYRSKKAGRVQKSFVQREIPPPRHRNKPQALRRRRRDAGSAFSSILGLNSGLNDIIADFIGVEPVSRSRDRRNSPTDEKFDSIKRKLILRRIAEDGKRKEVGDVQSDALPGPSKPRSKWRAHVKKRLGRNTPEKDYSSSRLTNVLNTGTVGNYKEKFSTDNVFGDHLKSGLLTSDDSYHFPDNGIDKTLFGAVTGNVRKADIYRPQSVDSIDHGQLNPAGKEINSIFPASSPVTVFQHQNPLRHIDLSSKGTFQTSEGHLNRSRHPQFQLASDAFSKNEHLERQFAPLALYKKQDFKTQFVPNYSENSDDLWNQDVSASSADKIDYLKLALQTDPILPKPLSERNKQHNSRKISFYDSAGRTNSQRRMERASSSQMLEKLGRDKRLGTRSASGRSISYRSILDKPSIHKPTRSLVNTQTTQKPMKKSHSRIKRINGKTRTIKSSSRDSLRMDPDEFFTMDVAQPVFKDQGDEIFDKIVDDLRIHNEELTMDDKVPEDIVRKKREAPGLPAYPGSSDKAASRGNTTVHGQDSTASPVNGTSTHPRPSANNGVTPVNGTAKTDNGVAQVNHTANTTTCNNSTNPAGDQTKSNITGVHKTEPKPDEEPGMTRCKIDTKDDSESDTKDDNDSDTKDDNESDTEDDNESDTKDDNENDTKDDNENDDEDEDEGVQKKKTTEMHNLKKVYEFIPSEKQMAQIDKSSNKVMHTAFLDAVDKLVEDPEDCPDVPDEEKDDAEYYESVFQDYSAMFKNVGRPDSFLYENEIDGFLTPRPPHQRLKPEVQEDDREDGEDRGEREDGTKESGSEDVQAEAGERLSKNIPGFLDDRTNSGLAETGMESVASVIGRILVEEYEEKALDELK